MDDEKRRLRDEVADLSKAVRDLREQLAGRSGHHCHGCHCAQPVWVWPYTPATYPWTWHQPVTITCSSTVPNLSTDSTTVPNLSTQTSATYVTNTAATNALGAISYS